MKRTVLFWAAALLMGCVAVLPAGAQSKGFKLGQWVEIHNALLRELNRNYVDTLPLDRMHRKGIEAMLEELDPYTEYVPEEDQEDFQLMIGKTYGGIGAIIFKPEKDGNVIINEPYKDSPAYKNGLVCGDEILAIDGVSTHGLETKECSDRMKGKPGTVVKFLVKKLRSGDTLEVAVTRERIHLPDVEYAGILEDGKTGYIYQSGFTEGVSDALKAAVKSLRAQGMERLVLDLRNNGGGIMQEAVKIVGFFVPKGSLVVSARGRDSLQTREYRTSSDPIEPDLPIVVMVNAGSASASEIVSGALQDLDRATVIGMRTFGKGLVQSMVALPYNGQMKVTTAKYYTPSGRCVQNAPDSLTHEFKTAHGRTVRDGGGITPDYIIKGHNYSRLTYSLVVNGIVEQYTLQYVRNHPTIPVVDDFHFTDYDDFVTFAMDKEFDYRSSARTYFDQMKKTLEEDGLAESMSAQLEAMQKALEMDKETFLRLKKDEIIPFIEEEIAVRYYWQEAGIRVRLRYDDQLREALTKAPIQF